MCTNVSIPKKSKNGLVISARTMDFVKKLTTTVNFVPRGQSFPELDLPGEIHWKNKYGFIGIGHPVNDLPNIIYSDGLNETGLSAASLWLPCSTYPCLKADTPMLYNINFVNYVLGNFQNIYEVKEALADLAVVDISQYQPSTKQPLHFIISDSCGDHIIIEFINGVMQTYTNQMGLLTNEPSYDWHLMNLHNYENLSLTNNPKICWGDELYGSGLIGCPGDSTPPSRFIRAAFLQQSTFQPKNTKQSIGLALQILQTLTVPCGTVHKSSSETDFNWTQWGVIRDHTNHSIYFYTAFNSKLYGIHLNKMDFNASKQKHISLLQPDWYTDISKNFETVCTPINKVIRYKTDFITSCRAKGNSAIKGSIKTFRKYL